MNATRPPSIRERLSQALVQVSIVWGLAVSSAVWLTAQYQIDEVMDSALRESAEILFGMLSYNVAALPLQNGEAMPAPAHDERLAWQLVDASQQVMWRSHRAPAEPFSTERRTGIVASYGTWHVFALPFPMAPKADAMLYVAQANAERSRARVAAAMTAAGAALVAGTGCALWLRNRIRRELRPLQTFSQAVMVYNPLDARAHLASATLEELVPVRDAIVDLGERLALRVNSERAITAHAAHALRTPLAGMTAQLAVAMRESTPEGQPRLRRVRQAAERLSRVVTALLSLFRTGVEPQVQPFDLAALVLTLPLDGLQVRVAAGVAEAEASALLRVDPDLLAAALLNIFDNALRCGAQLVTVRSVLRGAEVVLQIDDDGPGLPREGIERLQAALHAQRYDDEAAGLGLGLMLADLVVRAHRGHLNLRTQATGFGLDLVFSVEALPAADP